MIVLTGPFLRAQPQRPFYAAAPLDSPRIAALKKSVEMGDRVATVAAFWEEVRKIGTPLIEPVASNPQYSWVTFLWQATEGAELAEGFVAVNSVAPIDIVEAFTNHTLDFLR